MKMRMLLIGAVAAALLAPRAHAQSDAYQPKPEEIEKKRNAAALDAQYKRALEHSTRDVQAVKTDPWENMRAPGDSKAKKQRQEP